MPRFIETDPIRLNQILMNLVGNAIKFTETGSVKLSVEYHASNKTVVFCVIDTGIGIAEDFRQGLFTQLSPADSKMNRAYGGDGLGLYISRNPATLLHSQQWFGGRRKAAYRYSNRGFKCGCAAR